MEENLKTVRIFYFKETDSMDIWFGDPRSEHLCEEVDDSTLLTKNKENDVIGIEIISLTTLAKKPIEVAIRMK